jgi:ATP-dependent DNA ligase
MLAQRAAAPFDSEDYLFEVKWDGVRCLVHAEGGQVRLQSRQLTDLTGQFPELAGVAGLPEGTVLDGELVLLDNGLPIRGEVLSRLSVRDAFRTRLLGDRCPTTYIAFDLLYLAGQSWMRKPLVERRRQLEVVVGELANDRVRVSAGVVGRGVEFYRKVRAEGHEGVVAKLLASPYVPGRRLGFWRKVL